MQLPTSHHFWRRHTGASATTAYTAWQAHYSKQNELHFASNLCVSSAIIPRQQHFIPPVTVRLSADVLRGLAVRLLTCRKISVATDGRRHRAMKTICIVFVF